MTALLLTGIGGLSEPPDTWVLWWGSDSNALVAYGGSKDELQTYFPQMSACSEDQAGFWDGRYTLQDENVLDYGISEIRVAFCTTVDWGNHLFNFWREVSGSSATYWTGSLPQETASEIEFSESWTFRGLGISLHVPADAGVSISGNTVHWSAIEDSGEAWGLIPTYSGISARSRILMTSVKQVSAAAFFFESAAMYVSVVAIASKSP